MLSRMFAITTGRLARAAVGNEAPREPDRQAGREEPEKGPATKTFVVDLAATYLNPSPQLNTHADRLPDLLTRPAESPDPGPAPQGTGKACALNRRLSDEARSAIATAYQEGVRRQVLADAAKSASLASSA